MTRWIRCLAQSGFLGWLLLVTVFLLADESKAQAAVVGSPTSHGGSVGQGSGNVLIGGQLAARVGDFAGCPLTCGPGATHVGGYIVNGSATVLINGVPAARVGSVLNETCATSTITNGVVSVLIGP